MLYYPFYVVNIIIKIVLSFDTHIIIIIIIIIIKIMQGKMVTKMAALIIRGILLLKQHSSAAYKQCLVFEMPIFCCSHNNEVL